MSLPGSRSTRSSRAALAAVAVVGALVLFLPSGSRGAGAGAGADARTRARAPHTECVVPGAGEPIDEIWRPDMAAAVRYARHRVGDIAFAVRTDHRFYGYRPDHVEWSASVVKAMLMVAYLDRPSVASRTLNGYDGSLLWPMITHSDNNAASTVDAIVGNAGLDALAARVGMTHFLAVAQPWGETHITARDQTRFFLHLDRYVVPRHRGYAMHLLASVTPTQRWGIGEVAPRGWKLYFKGGWGDGTGLLDHQVVLLRRGCARVSLAVLSMYDGSHAYGKATLREMFSLLLRHFPTGEVLYPVVKGTEYRGSVKGDTGTGDGLRFRTTRDGRELRHFALIFTNDPQDRCLQAKVLRIATIHPNPRGGFTIRGSSALYRYELSGRLVRRRRAAGAVTEQDRDPVTHAVTCSFTGQWLARANPRQPANPRQR